MATPSVSRLGSRPKCGRPKPACGRPKPACGRPKPACGRPETAVPAGTS